MYVYDILTFYFVQILGLWCNILNSCPRM